MSQKAPPPPDYAAANVAGAQANASLLPMQIGVDRAARLGSTYNDPLTGRSYDFTGMGDEQLNALDAASTERLMRSGADIQRGLNKDQYADLLQMLPEYNRLNLDMQRQAMGDSVAASRDLTKNQYDQDLQYRPLIGNLQRSEDAKTFGQNLDLGEEGTRRSADLQEELLPRLNALQRGEDATGYRQNLDLNTEAARRQADLQDELTPRANKLGLDAQLEAQRASMAAYKETDPTRYAMREKLFSQVNDELGAGNELTPRQLDQLQQKIRGSQAARGNVLGAGAGYDEAMLAEDAGRSERDSRRAQALQILQGGESRPQFAASGSGGAAMPVADYRSTAAVNPVMPNFQSTAPVNAQLPNFAATTTGGPNLNPVPVSSTNGFSFINGNAGQQGSQFAQTAYGQQSQNAQSQINPWMAGLGLATKAVGAMGGAAGLMALM